MASLGGEAMNLPRIAGGHDCRAKFVVTAARLCDGPLPKNNGDTERELRPAKVDLRLQVESAIFKRPFQKGRTSRLKIFQQTSEQANSRRDS